ncbi:MAG TPA: DNA repair protein RecO [Gemmatimonadales bacterium]|nr:DNA repair protein RecO [Gemmatimonadales bacterium]
MPAVTTPAVILATFRYSESSKIVRLATRDHGVQSAIAKGALRPRSRFGAALQLLSEGIAHLIVHEGRDLHLLTAFDVGRVPIGLARDLVRYATASALAEVMLRFAPSEPHPASYDALTDAFALLEEAPESGLEALGVRLLWQLVSVLGFAPALDECVRDGMPVPATGPLAFSTREGGALCARCAAQLEATRLPADARRALANLLDPAAELPALDAPHAAAHRRLAARFVRFHLAEGAELPALEFWERRPWVAA